ncbi:glycosyltransferase family 39 protein [Candidatus Viridilinea mediisalina]|nr:glycosyltransferase family 39 protein [Candidatus Viridilinea mediisalina]
MQGSRHLTIPIKPLLLWIGMLCLYLLTSAALLDNPDARSAYTMTRGLLLRGELTVPAEDRLDELFEKEGRDGAVYSKYGLVQPIAQIPLFLVAAWLWPANELVATQAAVALVNSFATATALLVLYSLAVALFRSQRIAVALALIYGGATMAWLYATLTYSEPLLTLILILVCRLLLAAEQRPAAAPKLLAAAGLLTGLAILTKYPAVIYVPALLWFAWAISRGARVALFAFMAPLALGVVVLAGYNYWRYEDILNTGYHIKELTRFPRPAWYGFYTLFFSLGKSIFVYAPPLLAAVFFLPQFARQHGAFGRLILLLIASSVIFYAVVRPWSGAWSPGPRYQLPVLPLALLALGTLLGRWPSLAAWQQWGFGASVASGVAVQIPLVAISYNDTLVLLQVITGGVYAWGFWFFDPDYMPLVWQVRILASALARAAGGPSLLPSPLPFSVDRPGQPIDQIACWFARLPPDSGWLVVAVALALSATVCLAALLRAVAGHDRGVVPQS